MEDLKMKKLLAAAILAASLLMLSSMAFASAGASILYQETDLGTGLWQYDYTFNNTSDAGESLYSVYLYFTQQASVTGSPLPTGWDGTVWAGTNTTDVIDTFSTDPGYDILANSSLNGFSFTIDHQAGNIAYDAYFSGDNVVSGTTAPIVPEPVSSILFLTGGAVFGGRTYWKKRKRA